MAINYFLKAEERNNKDARKKLGEIKKNIKRYKNPSQMKLDSLEFFLYQKEKSNEKVVISEKKESKITSSKSSLVISSKEDQTQKKPVAKDEKESINTTTSMSASSSRVTKKKERRLRASKPLETTRSVSTATPVLETPNLEKKTVQPNSVVELMPVIQEVKGIDIEPLSFIIVSNDQLPTESCEESGKNQEITESAISTSEATSKVNIRKTLSRTNSLNFEKPAKNKENSSARTLHRTQSLRNAKPQPQDSEVIHSEEPKRKKKKEHSTKMSLKNYLSIHKSEKKIEHKNSHNNLLAIESETPQATNETSQSLPNTHNPFKKLTRSLSDRDLKRKSDVSLSETVISVTLDELKSQGKAEWTRSGNTISATKKDDPEVHITIHTHDNSDKSWSERPEIVSDFLEFSSECDEG